MNDIVGAVVERPIGFAAQVHHDAVSGTGDQTLVTISARLAMVQATGVWFAGSTRVAPAVAGDTRGMDGPLVTRAV